MWGLNSKKMKIPVMDGKPVNSSKFHSDVHFSLEEVVFF